MAESKPVNRRILIDSIAFIVISLICLGEGYRLHVTADPNALSQRLAPGFYIIALGLILLVAGLAHLLRNLRSTELDPAPAAAATEDSEPIMIGLGAIVAALAGYALLMTWIGYFVGTALFFLAVFTIFRVRPWWLTIALSLALAGAFYELFVVYLDIVFPRGLLF